MCIRDSAINHPSDALGFSAETLQAMSRIHARDAALKVAACLLYTSDAADERSSVDLGGRRIIKKKTNATQ